MTLKEAIDADSGGGKLVLHLFGPLADFKRAFTRERMQAGSVAVRARRLLRGRRKRRDENQR